MNQRETQREQTRRAILDALAEVIVDSGALDFSVQEVADRAGVTHRTVYNHFPSRDALSEGLAARVDEVLSELGERPDAKLSVAGIPSMVGAAYRGFEHKETHVRAYVMLMVANRAQAKRSRDRTDAFAALLDESDATGAREAAAAVRMFLSSTGWHLLTEHFGLDAEEAERAATWATKTLLRAATDPQAEEADDEPNDDR